jgi:hypothetical protein
MIKNNKQRLFEMMNRVADMPMDISDIYLPNENTGQPLDEIDLEGVTHTCMNVDQLKDYLNKILANYELPRHKKIKPNLIIHNKSIKKTPEGEIDVQAFIDDITAEPNEIISKGNSKMLKSTTEDFYTVTIGLPAFRGIVYDVDAEPGKERFIVVHTCPGAGSCVTPCYARKGSYVRLPSVFLKQTRILNLLLNNPQRFKEKLKNEIKELKNNPNFANKEMRFRWNDSGDFFSKSYYQVGREIMEELKNEGYVVKPYAHTKVADIYNLNRLPSDFSNLSLKTDAPDFVISFSVEANKEQLKKVNLKGAKTSEIVGNEYFNDLFIKSDPRHFVVGANNKLIFKDKENGMNVLKQRISKGFNVPNDGTLLSDDEIIKTPMADKPIYNVIVQSKGETDISTQRPDVLRTFFLVH